MIFKYCKHLIYLFNLISNLIMYFLEYKIYYLDNIGKILIVLKELKLVFIIWIILVKY